MELLSTVSTTLRALYMYIAIAEAVEEWQKLKEQGKLEGEGEGEEEDIYAEARMVDVSVEFKGTHYQMYTQLSGKPILMWPI